MTAPARSAPVMPPLTEIFADGHIWTGAGPNDAPGRWAAAAVAVDGRWLAVGDEAAVAAALRTAEAAGRGRGGDSPRRESLAGGWLIPAFCDAHMHPLFGAVLQDAGLPLRAADGSFLAEVKAVARAVASAARRTCEAEGGEDNGRADRPANSGAWLFGYGWHPALTADPAFSRELLDAAAPGRPVYLLSLDAHFALVSTEGLRRLGALEFPAGAGAIPLGADGRARGLLLETPQFIASLRVLAQLGHERKARAFERFQNQALAAGLTTISEIVADAAALEFYARLRDEGRLRLRVIVSPYGPMRQREAMERICAQRGLDPEWISLGPEKYLLDGTPGNHNAAWFQPYADEPGTSGLLTISPDELAAVARTAVAAGRDLALHAAGDLSVHVALDAIERATIAGAGGRGGPARSRLRIEHFDNVTAEDMARLPALAARGLVASVQPTHFHPVYVETIARVLGPERMKREYPLASLPRAGVPLALNSDWPAAMSFAPLENFRAALHHGAESLDRGAALAALTWGNAYAARRESWSGAIAPGQAADAVLLDRDPLREGGEDARVLRVWIAGREAPLPTT